MIIKFATRAAVSLEKLLSSKTFLVVALIWFVLQASFIALSTKLYIPPDERWHSQLIQLYVRDGYDPYISDQSGYYSLGDVTTNVSWLYHYLFSFLYRLSPFSEQSSLFILRFVNIFLATLSLFFTYKLFRRLRLPPAISGLAIFALSNTLMFVFLSASINYDNLVILLSVISFYFLVGLVDKFTTKEFLTLLVVLIMGCITKLAFIPIALLIVIVLAFFYSHRLGVVYTRIITSWNKERGITVFLSVFVLIFLSLLFYRCISNLVSYGSIAPRCDRVLTIKQCEENPLYVRDRQLVIQSVNVDRIPLDEFAFKWTKTMQERIFGIFAHKSTSIDPKLQFSISLLLLSMLLAGIRMFNRRERMLNLLVMIALVYVAILFYINRSTYLNYGIFGVGLQGRYIFLVLFILYGAGFYYIWKMLNRYSVIRTLVLLVVIMTLFASSLPSYIVKTDSSWHTSKTKTINQKLQSFITTVIP